MKNLALELLESKKETVDDWDGMCDVLATEVNALHRGTILWIDGDFMFPWGWSHHIVPLIDGIVHDAWHPEALHPAAYLRSMFGKREIDVTFGGESIYVGRADRADYRTFLQPEHIWSGWTRCYNVVEEGHLSHAFVETRVGGRRNIAFCGAKIDEGAGINLAEPPPDLWTPGCRRCAAVIARRCRTVAVYQNITSDV